MHPHNNAAAPTGIGNGGQVGAAVRASSYLTPTTIATPSFSATEFAANMIAIRFGISPCMARLVAELAHLGGRLA